MSAHDGQEEERVHKYLLNLHCRPLRTPNNPPTTMNPATTDPEKARPPSELSDEEKAKTQKEEYEQGMGVTKIEALCEPSPPPIPLSCSLTLPDYVFGRGWKLVLLWFSIGLIAYVYALSQSTTSTYQAFATSAFGKHTIVGTIAVITGIMSAVAQPFIAKLADLLSRPFALAAALVLYTVGYIMVAAAPNITTVVAGRAVYTLGQTGISRVQDILVADITSLQWRGAVSAATSLPFVVNAFVAGYITQGIGALSQNGWRWGYGMFAILVPVSLLPTVLILFWGGHKAKQLGALSLASSSYARRHVLEQMEPPSRSLWETVVYYWVRIDGLGLLLIGFSFAGLLAPATLKTTAKGGYKNRECHACRGSADESLSHRAACCRRRALHHLYRVGVQVREPPYHAEARHEPHLCE